MKKNFIIDTNVIVQDPTCIYNFEDNDIYITMSVLGELDKIKSKNSEIAKSARVFTRILDNLINDTQGNVIKLGKKLGKLYLIDDTDLFTDYTDDSLIYVAKKLQAIYMQKFIIVSNDINLKLRARAVDIEVQRYHNMQVNKLNDDYGLRVVDDLDDDIVEYLYNNEDGVTEITDDTTKYDNNEYLILKSISGKSAIVRYVERYGKKFFALIGDVKSIYGISPKNSEQRVLVDALLSKDIELVVCNGVAGSGKTLLSMAVALHCLEQKMYNKILIYKSIIPFGSDIGYLKGDKEDKLRSWLQPFYDNLEYIYENKDKKTRIYDYLFDTGKIEIDALTYIRGRSIPKRFIIIDECQNLSAKEIKTILTRVGEDSKLVLLGDTQQIDNMYLDEYNNALTYVADKMRGCDNVAVILLSKSERSRLAQIAIDRL